MNTVSIIIPTLDNVENIASLIKRVFSVIRKFNCTAEVIVFDDGSSDGTCEKITALANKLPVSLLRKDGSKEVACTAIEGAKAAQYDLIIVLDRDLSHSPEDIPLLIRPIISGYFDIAITSGTPPGDSTKGQSLNIMDLSRTASFPAQIVTGADDSLSRSFALSKETLLAINLEAPGNKSCLELLRDQKENLNIIEIPISFHGRHVRTSKMSMADMQSYFSRLADRRSFWVPSGFLVIYTLLLGTGIIFDTSIYCASISLNTPLFFSHVNAVVSLLLAVLLMGHYFSPRRTMGHELFWQPFCWFLVALLLPFRFGVYAFVQNMLEVPSLLPSLLASTCSVVAVTYFIFRRYLRIGMLIP